MINIDSLILLNILTNSNYNHNQDCCYAILWHQFVQLLTTLLLYANYEIPSD